MVARPQSPLDRFIAAMDKVDQAFEDGSAWCKVGEPQHGYAIKQPIAFLPNPTPEQKAKLEDLGYWLHGKGPY